MANRGGPFFRRILVAALLFPVLAAAAGKPIAVEFGKGFRLIKGAIAAIPGGRATVRITKFINSPCPKGARCIWSGQTVITELTLDGKVVPPDAKDFPYDITVKNSDYKTYAALIVAERKREP